MTRLTKYEQRSLEANLLDRLKLGLWTHPDNMNVRAGEAWVSIHQIRYYLNKLEKRGLVEKRLRSRGWYAWYQYRAVGVKK